jgi:hypothetical protein
VVVPFTISSGECFFYKRGLFSGGERSNPNQRMAETHARRPFRLFASAWLLSGRTEYLQVPFADVGPIKVPEGLTDEQVLFLSNISPDRLHGSGVLQHPAARHNRDRGAVGRLGNSPFAAPSCLVPSRSSPLTRLQNGRSRRARLAH